MPEDVIARLAKLTPAAGPDRDELLFRAGRASARPARVWKIAAGVLAATQAVTAAAWLLRPGAEPTLPVSGPSPAPLAPPEGPPPESEPPPPSSYGELVRAWNRGGLPAVPPVADPAPAGPTLSVSAGWPADLTE